MLRSVRWRLVISYLLVTVLAVCLVGILALSFLKNVIERQELASMRANAEAIAIQAEPLIWPTLHVGALQDLAQTAAFLGNDQIRILGADEKVLATSMPGDEVDAYVWLSPPLELTLSDETFGSVIVSLPSFLPFLESSGWGRTPLGEILPPETALTLIQRIEEPWGDRLVFETGGSQVSIATPHAMTEGDGDGVERWRVRLEQIQRLTRTSTLSQTGLNAERAMTIPIGNSQEPLGYVEVVRQNALASQALDTTRRALLMAGLGAVGLSLIVGLVVSRGLSTPLNELAETAERMSEGDLSARARVRGGTEIEQVASQFNEMATRLQSSFKEIEDERDALRQFIADASHELRTPITALRNFNELLQGPAAEDAEARKEFLSESRTQLERLEWITQHLLDLSRIDAGLVNLQWEACDAKELVQAVAAVFRQAAREKGIELSINVPAEPLTLSCDRMRIEMALSNLLDNALKFTPVGGRAEIGADCIENKIRIWVQDNGQGIRPQDRQRIFDRFYRGAGEGSGLGLAIVRSIVQAHGGEVYLDEAWMDGSRFVVSLQSTG